MNESHQVKMRYWNTYGDGITDSQLYQAAEQASEDLKLCEVGEDALLWQDEEDGLLCKALDEAEAAQAETAAAAAVLQHLNDQAEQERAMFDVNATTGETADEEDSLLCKALEEAEAAQAETTAAAAVLQHLNDQAEQARATFDVSATTGETAGVFLQESVFDVAETAAATAILQQLNDAAEAARQHEVAVQSTTLPPLPSMVMSQLSEQPMSSSPMFVTLSESPMSLSDDQWGGEQAPQPAAPAQALAPAQAPLPVQAPAPAQAPPPAQVQPAQVPPPPQQQAALNNTARAITLYPYYQGDILPALNELQQQVRDVLRQHRQEHHGIKWYMALNVRYVKIGEDGERMTTEPLFRSDTVAAVNDSIGALSQMLQLIGKSTCFLNGLV